MSHGSVYQTTPVWDVVLKAVYWFPLFAFVLAAALWLPGAIAARLRGETDETIGPRLLLLAYAGGFLLAFNRPRDWVHLMMVYPSALLLGAALAWRLSLRLPRPLALLEKLVLGAGLAALLAVSVALMTDLRRMVDHYLDFPRGGVYADRKNGPIIDDVVAYANKSVPIGQPMPVYPVQTMLSFLTGRESAGGFHVIWPVQDPSRDDRIIADLEAKRVDRIIYSLSQYAHLGTFRTNAPRLYDYLVQNFTIDTVFAREPNGPLVTALRRRRAVRGDSLAGLSSGTKVELRWADWPFTRVLTQDVGTPGEPGTLRIPVDVPVEGGSLGFGYGVNPDRWLDPKGGPFTFTIAVQGPDASAEPERVFRGSLDPRAEIADRRWKEATADLKPWSGKHVELLLSIVAPTEPGEPHDLAGWADPRLIASGRLRIPTGIPVHEPSRDPEDQREGRPRAPHEEGRMQFKERRW